MLHPRPAVQRNLRRRLGTLKRGERESHDDRRTVARGVDLRTAFQHVRFRGLWGGHAGSRAQFTVIAYDANGTMSLSSGVVRPRLPRRLPRQSRFLYGLGTTGKRECSGRSR